MVGSDSWLLATDNGKQSCTCQADMWKTPHASWCPGYIEELDSEAPEYPESLDFDLDYD